MSAADQEATAIFLDAQARGETGKGLAGETVVRRRCTTCHRLDGATDDDSSLAPELRGWASPAWIEAQIEDPASGTTCAKGSTAKDLEGHMPAFADKITMADRRVLAAWVAKHGRATEMK